MSNDHSSNDEGVRRRYRKQMAGEGKRKIDFPLDEQLRLQLGGTMGTTEVTKPISGPTRRSSRIR